MSGLPEGVKENMYEAAVSYSQESPSESIDIAREDQGDGPYWVMTTERWSFNSLADLIDVFYAANRRLGIEEDPQSEIDRLRKKRR